MNKRWSIKLTDYEMKNLFQTPSLIQQEALSINKREKVDSNKEFIPERILTPVEQLIIGKHYVFKQEGISTVIRNVKQYGMDKIDRYSSLFKTTTYFYTDDDLKLVRFSKPKEKSLELFEKQMLRINEFVRSIYLIPNNKFVGESYSRYFSREYVSNMKKSGFLLNGNVIDKINLDILNKQNDIYYYLNTCHPIRYDYEPNLLLFDENILTNYSIKLLSTLEENG